VFLARASGAPAGGLTGVLLGLLGLDGTHTVAKAPTLRTLWLGHPGA
jgi:hypothetical protein